MATLLTLTAPALTAAAVLVTPTAPDAPPVHVDFIDLIQARAHPGDTVTVSVGWYASPTARPGDSTTLTLPALLADTPATMFDVTDPTTGDVVAVAHVERGILTLTLSDYAATHTNVGGTLTLSLLVDAATAVPGTTYDLVFTSPATTRSSPLTIVAPTETTADASGSSKWANLNTVGGPGRDIQWGIIGPQITNTYAGATYTFTDDLYSGQELDCGNGTAAPFDLVLGTYNTTGDVVASTYLDAPNEWTWTCTPTRATATLDTTGHPEWVGLVPQLVGWTRITDPTQDSWGDLGTVTIAGLYERTSVAFVNRLTGTGTGTGTAPDPNLLIGPTPELDSAPELDSTPVPAAGPTIAPSPTTSPTPTTAPISPTPTPTSTLPPTSAPIPTSTPTPTSTPRPAPPRDLLPPMRTPTPRLTSWVQVDTYHRVNAHLAVVLPRILADRRLTWREDRPFWGHSTHEIVRVRVPVRATAAQWTRAINAATRRSADVSTTSARLPRARGHVTVAWLLTGDATPHHPWGADTRHAQRLIARS